MYKQTKTDLPFIAVNLSNTPFCLILRETKYCFTLFKLNTGCRIFCFGYVSYYSLKLVLIIVSVSINATLELHKCSSGDVYAKRLTCTTRTPDTLLTD
jgi:hypothetical protein